MNDCRNVICVVLVAAAVVAWSAVRTEARTSGSAEAVVIRWEEVGATATGKYRGDGLGVTPTARGARLRCVFQKLEGDVTPQGLYLRSTVNDGPAAPVSIQAAAVGRPRGKPMVLAPRGTVDVRDGVVRRVRPGLHEEYRVDVDGVRQDFVVQEAPPGSGPLRVTLELSGATAEEIPGGARLTLPGAGRRLAYGRLRVNDATGRALPARLVAPSPDRLAIHVEDANAVYPVRVDPTFSDATWRGMGVAPGLNGDVYALAVDENGNLYAGGYFATAGGLTVDHVSRWNGSAWSALGSGTDGTVWTLAIDGAGDLYAAGEFTTAGGDAASHIARWDGAGWSPLGSGINDRVYALALDGRNRVYAAGDFTMAGGVISGYAAYAVPGSLCTATLTGIQRAGGGVFQLLFTTDAAENLVLQKNTNLPGAWQDVGGSFSSQPGPNVLPVSSSDPATFWRLRLAE